MADVYTVTFSVIGILISLPALIIALNLLLPNVTKRAQSRLMTTPGRCFLLGIPVTAAFVLWIAITSQVELGLIRATAFIAAGVGMGIGTIGAAGLARLLGERLDRMADPGSELKHLTRGAVVFELACLVPIVGWFLFAPLAGIMLMGATVFGLLGWLPRRVFPEQLPLNSEQSSVTGNQTA
ncbi:MAG: hypothetical protein ACE5E7_05245 [Anaerolineae bacterium]